MFKRNLLIILSVLTVVLLAFSIYKIWEDQKMGNVQEREELLSTVMWEVATNSEILKEDIDNIKVLKSHAGVYPFNYDVAINLKDGTQLLYGWADKEKSNVKQSGQ